MSRITLNRIKQPLDFRSRKHTEQYIISKGKSAFDFQNDLKSQQAIVEFQILKVYRKTRNFWKKFDVRFPEWHQIAYQADRTRDHDLPRSLPTKPIGIETYQRKFQIPNAYRKLNRFWKNIGDRCPEWTQKSNEPPLNVRFRRHTEKYNVCSERKSAFDFQNDLKS